MYPTILLNPGPVNLTERVRNALLRQDICHRETEFIQLCQSIRHGLASVYEGGEKFEPFLITGSGTAAVEAMITSLIPKRGKALVISNGIYGERIINIMSVHNKSFCTVKCSWLEDMNFDRVAFALKSDTSITHIVAVHNETTTGRLNDISRLGRICHDFGKKLLIDAVSSFGGENISLTEWGVEALAATANKCLHSVPGISFVLVERTALERVSGNASSIYLDLSLYRSQIDSGLSPFTSSIQVCYALDEALRELKDGGGWRYRNQRYLELSSYVRTELNKLGIDNLLSKKHCASMLQAFHLPTGTSFQSIHDSLRDAGFVIYAGKGELSSSIFLVATMGEIGKDDLFRLVEALSIILTSNNK